MKRTPEDDAFAAEFGKELRPHYAAAKTKGTTDAEFASSIGVERAQLEKYLRGESVPAIRTLALAKRLFGLSIPYDGVLLTDSVRKRRRKADTNQMEFPFVIRAEGRGQFDVRIRPVSARRFVLDLIVKRSGT